MASEPENLAHVLTEFETLLSQSKLTEVIHKAHIYVHRLYHFYHWDPYADIKYQLNFLLNELEFKENRKPASYFPIKSAIDKILSKFPKEKNKSNHFEFHIDVDLKEEIEKLQKLNQDVYALCLLGLIYQRGIGQPIDHANALQYFRSVLALKKDNIFALHNIGFYFSGFIYESLLICSYLYIDNNLAKKIFSYTMKYYLPSQYELAHAQYGQKDIFEENANGRIIYSIDSARRGEMIDELKLQAELLICDQNLAEYEAEMIPQKIETTKVCLFMFPRPLQNLTFEYSGWLCPTMVSCVSPS